MRDYNDAFEGNTLDALLAYLKTEAGQSADWSSLPTFGGPAPVDTFGVWSWDPNWQLVGDCAAELEIVPRPDV